VVIRSAPNAAKRNSSRARPSPSQGVQPCLPEDQEEEDGEVSTYALAISKNNIIGNYEADAF